MTLVFFLVVQLFVAQPFQVQQPSMENTLMPDQYVLVDKLTPHFDDYHRGDIVVFNPPAVWAAGTSGTPFIKRVIGVGNDTVDIHGGHVFVNGKQLVGAVHLPGPADPAARPRQAVWTLTRGPALRHGRPPPGFAGFARLRADRQVDRDRPGADPLLAPRQLRADFGAEERHYSNSNPMTGRKVAIPGVAVA